MSLTRSPFRSKLPAALAAAAIAAAGADASAAVLAEGFTTGVPVGWTVVNNSVDAANADEPDGWFQGVVETATFSAQAGTSTSYVAASYNATAGDTISAWLITPTMLFLEGDVLTFYTRTVTNSQFPDALEVRFSSVGGTNVGTTATSVGTFTTTLLSINPSLTVGGYPTAWTQYSVAINGLSGGAATGAIAFRYYVTDAGPLGNNSNYIGVDTLTIAAAVPEPATYATMALGAVLLAWRRRSAARRDA